MAADSDDDLATGQTDADGQRLAVGVSDVLHSSRAPVLRGNTVLTRNLAQDILDVEASSDFCSCERQMKKVLNLSRKGNLIDTENKLSLQDEHLNLAFEKAASHLTNEEERKEFMVLKSCLTLSSLNTKTEMSHTYQPVRAALAALHWSGDFRSFISELSRLAGDSSSNACVAGAILGCCWGYAKLPKDWVDGLRKQQIHWLNARINHLLDILGSP
ncbi:hypothetical protein Btru_061503 [Bulinus truncatus]|nr:hypothetical protein Btru_061503 [Bulinus truncatus]